MSKHIVIGKKLNKVITFSLIFGVLILSGAPSVFAGPQSTTYELKSYDFGSGGTTGNTSTTYSLFGNTGQVDGQSVTSTTYSLGPGLTYLLKVNVPGAPTLSTPANNYDRIKITLNTNSNPSDTTYAVQLSTTSNFSSNVYYAKASTLTIGTTLTSSDFQTNSTWGTSGFFISGLTQGTTYYVRVKARQGNYTETEWGPSSSITTQTSSLSFSLGSTSVTFNQLGPGNSYTDSTKSTTLTTTTNAYNGYIVYGYVDKALTNVSDVTKTIANYAGTNATPTSWSGTGFGYTTNDTNLQTGSGGTNRFSSGTLYAGFGTTGPGDPIADDLGPVQSSQISNEQFTIFYRVTANATTVAGTYKNTILYTIVPAF